MQAILKDNILKITKEKGWSINKLGKEAGLNPSFINNFLYDKSKNPGIESIVKIAKVLDIGIDELVGISTQHKFYKLEIKRIDIFAEITVFLAQNIKSIYPTTISLDQYTQAIYHIYTYSLNKDLFDKEFAQWYLHTHLNNDRI